MRAGLLNLTLLKSFSDMDLIKIYAELNLDYDGVVGDRSNKVKALTMYYIENYHEQQNRLIGACYIVRPDIDWATVFFSGNPASLGNMITLIKRVAALIERKFPENLPSWWREFYISIESWEKSGDLDGWLKSLSAEQFQVAQAIMRRMIDARMDGFRVDIGDPPTTKYK